MKKKSYIVNNEVMELIIPGYPKGSNLTIINTAYVGRRKNEEGKLEKDFLLILFRDNDIGAKKVHIIYEPLYTFYKLKNGYEEPDYNLFFIEKEKVNPYTCKYADILAAIAEVTDNTDFYMDNISDRNMSENRKLHLCTNIFMSDMDVENYYRFLFGLSYTNETFKIAKGFVDIETDGRYAIGDFPEPGEVPINAIAYCDEAHNVTYQFIFNDKRNPEVEKYKQDFNASPILEELHSFVINAVGGYKKAVKFGVDKMEYKIVFFDDELEMITKMFEVINRTVPDFIEFWNWDFDMNYIIARIENLGADPLDIICDSRINLKLLRFYVDERNKSKFEERNDFLSISGYSVWLDQMIQFASRRKGRSKFVSYRLDAIGEDVAGVRKLDYSHITKNINMLPYLDMKTFSFYNVMDVIVQKCIEVSTQDIEYIFTKCLVNNTVYSKGHRQSVYLTNRFSKDFYEYGYIIGNNKNRWNEKPKTKFPGAMVGDPLHNDFEKVSLKINGRPTLLVNNAVDFDYSSLYPSIILENNLAPNTQIGKIIIEDPEDPNKKISLNEHQNMYSSDDEIAKYSRGGEFLENLMSGNPLEFCRRWMMLGSIYDVLEDIREYYKYNKYIGKPLEYGNKDVVYYTKDKGFDCVEFYKDYTYDSVVSFQNTLDNTTKKDIKENIRKGAIL